MSRVALPSKTAVFWASRLDGLLSKDATEVAAISEVEAVGSASVSWPTLRMRS